MEYQDFKYVMADISKVYIGTRLSYKEFCEHDFTPVKLSMIAQQYFYKDVTEDTTIEEHLFHMDKKSLSYMTMKALKVKLKMSIYVEETDKKGKTKGKWLVDQLLTLDQYLDEESYRLYPEHAIVNEIIINKLQIMMFSI